MSLQDMKTNKLGVGLIFGLENCVKVKRKAQTSARQLEITVCYYTCRGINSCAHIQAGTVCTVLIAAHSKSFPYEESTLSHILSGKRSLQRTPSCVM